MIVVRMLLNSWATLEASVPTLLRRWARSNCSRNCSVSDGTDKISSPIIHCLRQDLVRGTRGTRSCSIADMRLVFTNVSLDKTVIAKPRQALHSKCPKCLQFKLLRTKDQARSVAWRGE